MKMNLTLCLFLLIAAGCRPDEEPKNNATIDYIHQTGRLWGVAELKLNENNSITLIDAKSSGYGYALIMRDSKSNVVDSITLKPGQACTLSDGRHAFITYELKAIEAGRISITVTDKFDARSFGDGIKEVKKTITISPYKKQDSPQQTN
ncbi:MAG TPA: hypothetical protein VMY06_09520 [Sedimentisphaerales bacterium]|nr:hypothetical protein [Sedimentisphaerales bacterium]